MSYRVNFTDPSQYITVEDRTINSELDISFIGKYYTNYAPVISENFLHLLENFSDSQAPQNPITGQLWFDTSSTARYLKIYNGINWSAVGFLQKSSQEPDNPAVGDLWVNPASSAKKLMMYTGSAEPSLKWQLIGPANTTDSTKIEIEELLDNNSVPVKHEVVSVIFNGTRIGIVSQNEFTPKEQMAGFSTIRPGINLNSQFSNVKFWGTAESAQSLIIDNSPLDLSKLVLTDKINSVTSQFNIRANSGLTVGTAANLSVSINNSKINVNSTINDQDIVFQTIQSNVVNTSIYIDSSGNVGIGNTPDRKLDVFGSARVQGGLEVADILTTNLLDKSIIISGKLITDNLSATQIIPTPTLPATFSGNQNNHLSKYIGKAERLSFLKGSWVGTSISVPTDPDDPSNVEHLVMSVDNVGGVIIDGWASAGGFSPLSSPQVGKLLRVSETTPCLYFYAVDLALSEKYGCALYSVIVNKMCDIATFTLLSNGSCSDQTMSWRHITFFKMSDNPNDATAIKSALNEVNQGWV